ncbi:MAG: TetR/AcrR family transcriptional regulator [Nibricoccus sp.]
MPAAVREPPLASSLPLSLSDRILTEARALFFSHGYSAFTMDDLAAALGMSKKTLYVHHAGKDAMIRAVLDGFAAEVRADTEALLANRSLQFAEKLRGFAQGMVDRLSQISPEILADLEQYAPPLHRYVLQVRAKNLPYVFGRFIEEGQMSGAVRDDVSPVFASEFFLHAMQGLLHADALKRLRMNPETCFDNAIRLFFGGLLTPQGHKEYEKLFPR